MRHRHRPFLAAAAVTLLALALSGCGRTVSALKVTPSAPTETPTLFPTATPTPSPTVTPIPTDCVSQLNHAQNLVHSGDLLVSMEFSLAYPSNKLPDNLPFAPYNMTGFTGGKIPTDPSVNPNLVLPSGGYWGVVCNASASATHPLTGLSLRINSFTPSPGQVNAWNVCSTTYTRQGGVGGGGCGGGIADPNCAQATFPAGAGAGATTPLAPTGCTMIPLPRGLAPGIGFPFNLGIIAPTAPGTYTFSLGISLDGAAPVYVPVPHQLLLDPSARVWDGQSCTTPAMQSQIPANDTAAYICPTS